MAASRTIWKGAISFGLVTIPIRLHSAVEEKSFKFNQLHAKDSGRIKMKRTCSVCSEEVPFDEIVKGYEYDKDHYVTLTDEEMDRGIAQLRTIDVLKFVAAEEIDPIYWKASYYLAPDGAAAIKAYKLLSQALADDGRVAIAKVAFREKEHLATLRARDGVFMLETMYWPDEIRDAEFEELSQDVEIDEQGLKLARTIIENLTGEFDPSEYSDTYRAKLEGVVQQKIDGKEIAVVESEQGTAKVLDLIEALKASVEATAKGESRKKSKEAATA